MAVNDNFGIPSNRVSITEADASSHDTIRLKNEIAVIGMAGRFPGAENPDDFWENLIQGKNSIREIPPDRWDWKAYLGDPQKEKNKTNSKWGGFLSDISSFDPLFFGISPKEANYIDPQHRIFLEIVWRVMENAGYGSKNLSGKKIGVYAGVSKNDYAELLGDNISAFVSTGTVHSILANRVSYLFNFSGPSVPIDTACSSSLVALNYAVRDIRDGECESAIVGGVNLLISPRMYISHAKSGMLSKDGQCKAFDESANGYVRAEGAGAIFIKPLHRALEDRDNVLGIIKSVAVNHGGRANFLTAPNVNAQANVVYDALNKSGIDPRAINYIEAHGTGTQLGDPIEINALKKAHRRYYEDKKIAMEEKNYCGIGSVKTNIGHMESGAGMASVIKVLLALQHQKLPPSLNFQRLNPYIEIDDSPFYIVKSPVEWKQRSIEGSVVPRTATVSGFGMGGVNAHVILQQAPEIESAPARTVRDEYIILLSSKKGRIKDQADQLFGFLKKQDAQKPAIEDIEFTLMFGRDEFEEKLAFVVRSVEQLIDSLEKFCKGESPEFCFHGAPAGKKGSSAIAGNAESNLPELAGLWTQGEVIEWDIASFEGRRVRLPGYIFAKQRCWFKELDPESVPKNSVERDAVYKIMISPDSSLLTDHRVRKTKTMPAVGYLESVIESLNLAAGLSRGSHLSFGDIYWLSPFQADDQSKELTITVKTENNKKSFEIGSGTEIHCKGNLEIKTGPVGENKTDIDAIIQRCRSKENKTDLYAMFREYGLDYGTNFQAIDTLYYSQDECLAVIDPAFSGNAAGLLDGALQSAVGLSIKNKTSNDKQFVPYSVERLDRPGNTDAFCYYYVKQLPGPVSLNFEIYCLDKEGGIVAAFTKFTKRALAPVKPADESITHYFTPTWIKRDSEKNPCVTFRILSIDSSGEPDSDLYSGLDKSTVVHRLAATGLDDPEKLKSLLKENKNDWDHIIYRSGNPGINELHRMLTLTQSLILAKLKQPVKIIYYGIDIAPADLPFLHSIGGLARTLKYEYPKIDLRVIAFDKSAGNTGELLCRELGAEPAPLNEIKYIDAERFCREMSVLKKTENTDKPSFTRGGTYIISGGGGGLGRIFAGYFARNYKANLVLIGRRAADENIRLFIDDLQASDGRAEYYTADIRDENQVRQVIQAVREKFGKIHGVIQASGVIDDGFILNKTLVSFDRAIGPKIPGTLNLDNATASDELEFFVMFSSVASLMPNQGQCDYASGNSFMDYYADYRNRLVAEKKRSGISLAINWPLWENGGMQVTAEEKDHLYRVFGMKPLSTAKGLLLFEEVLAKAGGSGIPQVLGIEGDSAKIHKRFGIRAAGTGDVKFDIPDLVRKDLGNILILCLGKAGDRIESQKPLREYGIDSVVSLKITGMLNRFFGINCKPTLLFEYETMDQIYDYLIKEKSDRIRENYTESGAVAPLYRSSGLLDLDKSDLENNKFQRRYTNREFYMVDHVVEGKYNVPGACYIEMARQAAVFAKPELTLARLTNNYWAKQLSSGGEPFDVFISLTDKADITDYEIYSKDDRGRAVVHAAGSIVYRKNGEQANRPENLDLVQIRKRCDKSRTRDEVYRQIHAEGLLVGPTFMPMLELSLNENEALALLELPETVRDTYSDYLLHPTMLTGVFQAALINNRYFGDDESDFIPIAIENLEVYGIIPNRCYVYSESSRKSGANTDIRKFNLFVCNETGKVLARLDNFTIKARNTGKQAQPGETKPEVQSGSSAIREDTIKKDIIPQDMEDIRQKAQDFFKGIIAPPVGLSPNDINPGDAFEVYGINSVLILELNQALEKAFGSGLSKTLFFEYRNIADLTDYFLEEHREALVGKLSAESKTATPARMPVTEIIRETTDPFAETTKTNKSEPVIAASDTNRREPPIDSRDIAIIGLAGRYPQAKTIGEFWENLENGKDCIEIIRPDRFDYSAYYTEDKSSGTLYSKWGGFIDGMDEFDPLFFHISPLEAEMMDPQERLFLQTAWHSIEDAGYTRKGLSGENVGVFVGALWQPYLEAGIIARENGSSASPSALLYNIANRVSYYCDFKGPSMAVDTACSSSLTALHLACGSILKGECSVAIAGGVNLSVGASKYLFLSQYQFLSTDGRCRSFGAGGDGYVPGEGVGAVVIKPLDKAVRDNDHIYGIIKSTAVNHGGKTNGYSVPNPVAQSEMIAQALEKAGVNPRTIGYIETHGTGTALGDPIEITGLNKAFSKYTKDRQFCRIGSVKSNIGHLEAAAGIAGLTKVLLQLKHSRIAPSIHSHDTNPFIDFKSSPFIVQQELVDWARPKITIDGITAEYPRTAAISSFGAGGSNAHVIIEEYTDRKDNRRDITRQPVVIVLSGKTEDSLKEYAQSFIAFFAEDEIKNDDLVNIAFTLQTGREAMNERLALIAENKQEIVDLLTDFLAGRSSQALVHDHASAENQSKDITIENNRETINTDIPAEQYQNLIGLWVKGRSVDWNALYPGTKPMRVSLPVYPFEKGRYWLPGAKDATGRREKSVKMGGETDPLGLENRSNFFEQKYAVRLTGNEFFLADHIVKDLRILPGVVYLEMAMKAIARALNFGVREYFQIDLHNIVWIRPIAVENEPIDANIRLSMAEGSEISFEIYEDSDGQDQEPVVFCQGTAVISATEEPPSTDLDKIKRQCDRGSFTSGECYSLFESIDARYGDRLKGIREVRSGSHQLLVHISMPDNVPDESSFFLHPGIMDPAVQTCLISGKSGIDSFGSPEPGKPYLPFALQRLRLFKKPQKEVWAIIRPNSESVPGNEVRKSDIDIVDDNGIVCVRLEGFSTRKLEGEFDGSPDSSAHVPSDRELRMLAPVWENVVVEESEAQSDKTGLTVVIGDDDRALSIGRYYPGAVMVHIETGMPIEQIADSLRKQSSIGRIVWISSGNPPESMADETLISGQERGCIKLFRIIKALLSLGYAARELEWIIITENSAAVTGNEISNPTDASIHGLVGTMARECPNWKVLAVDLDKTFKQPLSDITKLHPEPASNLLVYHGGMWYRQKLIPFSDHGSHESYYKKGGVYVVIGGAGGIGEAWSEYVASKYGAQTIWIGRRPLDETIRKKIDGIAESGPKPVYISADATQLQELTQAYDTIIGQFQRIDGVIHSAIVLADQSLANMDEKQFRAGLSAKIDISVNLARVFLKTNPDFILFFSSANSYLKTPGQSNYVAGCTFQDEFANQLARSSSSRVRTMNWGFWGSTGIVASGEYRDRMADSGIGSIETPEGMQAVEVLLSAPIRRLACIKTTGTASIRELNIDSAGTKDGERMEVYPDNSPSVFDGIRERMSGNLTDVRSLLLDTAADLLGIPVKAIGTDTEWADFGFDAVLIGTYCNRINEKIQANLTPGILTDNPDLGSLADYISRERLYKRSDSC